MLVDEFRPAFHEKNRSKLLKFDNAVRKISAISKSNPDSKILQKI